MKRSLTASDILSDIEFELAQGAISRNDLGQGIQAIKQYQNKMRSEVFLSARQTVDRRETVGQQFQINDMHVTLMQEMAAAIQSLRSDLRQIGEVRQNAPVASIMRWSTAEVENAMRSKALHVKPDVRSIGVPVIGGLLQRLRVALHHLPLFYVQRLADKQAAINRTYGEWILHLTRLYEGQQEEIEALGSQVAALQNRLAELERSSNPSADPG